MALVADTERKILIEAFQVVQVAVLVVVIRQQDNLEMALVD